MFVKFESMSPCASSGQVTLLSFRLFFLPCFIHGLNMCLANLSPCYNSHYLLDYLHGGLSLPTTTAPLPILGGLLLKFNIVIFGKYKHFIFDINTFVCHIGRNTRNTQKIVHKYPKIEYTKR